MSTVTLPILQAIDGLIEKARSLNTGIPEVTVVLGAAGYTKKRQVHGHFAPNSWKSTDDQGAATHEVLLSGESLKRGAEATLGTLLHELAHAKAHAQGIKDTSNNGRYHNKKFKELGLSFGLELDEAPTIGWSVTTLATGTAELYKDGLAELTKALTKYRVPNMENETAAKKAKKFLMECPTCQDPVQVTKKWTERNEFNLRCALHDEDFYFYEEDPNGE